MKSFGLIATVCLSSCASPGPPTEQESQPLKLRSLGDGLAILIGDLDGGGCSELIVLAPNEGQALLVRGEGGGVEMLKIGAQDPAWQAFEKTRAAVRGSAPELPGRLAGTSSPRSFWMRRGEFRSSDTRREPSRDSPGARDRRAPSLQADPGLL
jgi:hypothetical protein